MIKTIFYIFLLLICSCATRPNSTYNESAAPSEENEFANAEQLFNAGKAEASLSAWKKFQRNFPHSGFFELARLREAECIEILGRPQDSLVVYRSIILKTEKQQPEIATLAMYRMATAYEAIGDDMKMSSALLDAQARGKFLPEEVSRAQIPARLAGVYARQGQQKESMQYLLAAEEGLNSMIRTRGSDLDKTWLAKIYFEMGKASTSQLSVENFEDFVETQKVVQSYLLRSLKLNQAVWSERSEMELRRVYRDLLIQVEGLKKGSPLKPRLAGAFFELLDRAELFRPLKDESSSPTELAFFDYLETVRAKADLSVFGNTQTLPLSEESEKLNSIKRQGRVKPTYYLPEELNSVIKETPKIVPTIDPNL